MKVCHNMARLNRSTRPVIKSKRRTQNTLYGHTKGVRMLKMKSIMPAQCGGLQQKVTTIFFRCYSKLAYWIYKIMLKTAGAQLSGQVFWPPLGLSSTEYGHNEKYARGQLHIILLYKYHIYWHIRPPYVARASKGIYYGRWSVRHTNFAATLRWGGSYKLGGLIAKGGLICQFIR